MTLPINWAVGNTYAASDMNTLSQQVNQLVGTTKTSGTATSGTGQVQMMTHTIAANTLAVGTAFRVFAFGTQSTTSANLVWQLHVGTANTTADQVVCATPNSPIAASGGARAEGLVTFRTTGASGTCFASIVGQGSSAAGVSTNTATFTVSSTVAQYLTLSVAASAGTHTVQQAAVHQA